MLIASFFLRRMSKEGRSTAAAAPAVEKAADDPYAAVTGKSSYNGGTFHGQ